MWGHPQGCGCGLCSSLQRLHRLVAERTHLPGFVLFGTLRLRNLLGELEDWADHHPAREAPAQPPRGQGARAPAERLPAAVANADIEPQLHRSTGTELVSGAGEVKKEEEKFEPGTGPLPGETEAEGAARTLAPKVHPQPKSDKGSEQSRKSEPSATATRRSTGGGEGVREARSRSPRRRETKEKKVSRSRSRRARSSGGRRRRNSRSASVPRARPTQGWVC